jgi:hypothetical protein
MKKEILLVLYSLIIGTVSAQYQIDLSKVTPPSVSFLQLGMPVPPEKKFVSTIYIWKKEAFRSYR